MDTTLDPAVVNLARAIRQQESGGDFTIHGKSGEYGGYQFTPDTWNEAAPKYGIKVPLEQATPQQQNAVAYNRIKAWKDAGKNVTQISSMWNAGEGEPDAYTGKFSTGKPSIGTNSFGAKYDVPSYAKAVANYYLQYKNGGQSSTPTAEAATTPVPGQTPPSPAPQPSPVEDTSGATFPASPSDTVAGATLKSIGNVPSSLLNLGKSLFSAVTHPINTIKGIGNAFAGGMEEGFKALTGESHTDNKQTETFDALIKVFKDRYGSLENAQKTATNDPVGFGADVFSILDGGASLLKATTGLDAVSALDRGVSAVGGGVADATGKVLSAPAKLGAKVLGQSTGEGSVAIKTAFDAGTKGGEANRDFITALRGNTKPEELVSKAREALSEVVNTRSSNYKEMLSSLEKDTSTLDLAPMKSQLEKTLDNFNIAKDSEGGLNFDESTIVSPSDQASVKAIVKDIENWKDTSPLGIDRLKQRIANYYEPGSKIGAFSESLRKVARGMIDDTPGYTSAMRDYSEMSDQIKDIKQGLSLGDKTGVETSYNKLIGSLNTNREFRLSILKELDEATGSHLTEIAAGKKLGRLAPKGLAKYADQAGIVAAATHGIGIVPVLVGTMTTSPRIVGEFVHALGLGAQATSKIMSLLNKAAVPAVIGGSVGQKINP